RTPPDLVRREHHADAIAADRVRRRGQAVARARTMLLSLLALDGLRGPSEVPDRAPRLQQPPHRHDLEPRGRLRRLTMPAGSQYQPDVAARTRNGYPRRV